jgi:hypothetical protein
MWPPTVWTSDIIDISGVIAMLLQPLSWVCKRRGSGGLIVGQELVTSNWREFWWL